MRRPKARLCFLCFLFWMGMAIIMLLALSVESSEGAVYRKLGLAFDGLALVTGTLAAVFRFTERPREVVVRDFSDWDEPPVIHVKGRQ
jgi:hypothetical protein